MNQDIAAGRPSHKDKDNCALMLLWEVEEIAGIKKPAHGWNF